MSRLCYAVDVAHVRECMVVKGVAFVLPKGKNAVAFMVRVHDGK